VKTSRRRFIKGGLACVTGAAVAPTFKVFSERDANRPKVKAPYIKNSKIANKVIVLGFDGMDPNLVKRFILEGELPTFKRLMEMGKFGELQSTMPPQSPVAWASFITGTNPGGNGIFDFVHRDPAAFIPYLSTSRSFDSKESFKLGDWNVPLGSGKVELMRKGTPFWDVLTDNGIPATVFQIPANFPVVGGEVKAVSGMGTPDLLGTYGTFTMFTEDEFLDQSKLNGGRQVKVTPVDNIVRSEIAGPKNSFRVDQAASKIPFTVRRDPISPIIKIDIAGHEVMLRQGEWSEWVPLSFELLPFFVSVAGMVRFYAKEVYPSFKLYVSPINIDPMEPTLPICSPEGYSREVADMIGRFYTQGFPSDTKALSQGALSDEEYMDQAQIVLDESIRAFDYTINRFNEGFYFFYFSSTDQNSHMLWRTMFPDHPLYDPNASSRVKNALKTLYRRMDEVVKKTLSKVDSNTTLFVLSDHGFSSFAREFHISTWLVQNGFTVLTDPSKMGEGEFYRYVDWKRTKAYALGLNGIYLNLKGRESRGSLEPSQAEAIKQQIILGLQGVIDPKTGQPIITQAYDSSKIYSGPYAAFAPDIVVGYRRGYRISDEAVLGKFPLEMIGDRTDKWSADHCSDPQVVPGILLSNKSWSKERPGLWDMGPTIIRSFGLTPPPLMEGRSIFES
jgi:predicted AlkP superfamily phosphohydrolase/phosphomutase